MRKDIRLSNYLNTTITPSSIFTERGPAPPRDSLVAVSRATRRTRRTRRTRLCNPRPCGGWREHSGFAVTRTLSLCASSLVYHANNTAPRRSSTFLTRPPPLRSEEPSSNPRRFPLSAHLPLDFDRSTHLISARSCPRRRGILSLSAHYRARTDNKSSSRKRSRVNCGGVLCESKIAREKKENERRAIDQRIQRLPVRNPVADRIDGEERARAYMEHRLSLLRARARPPHVCVSV